jgi:hypothetical protein
MDFSRSFVSSSAVFGKKASGFSLISETVSREKESGIRRAQRLQV